MEFAGSTNWGRDDWQVAAICRAPCSAFPAPGGRSRNKVILQDAAGRPGGILQIANKAQDVLPSTQVSTRHFVEWNFPCLHRKENAPSNTQAALGVRVCSAALLQCSSASHHLFGSGGCDWCSLTSPFSSSRAHGHTAFPSYGHKTRFWTTEWEQKWCVQLLSSAHKNLLGVILTPPSAAEQRPSGWKKPRCGRHLASPRDWREQSPYPSTLDCEMSENLNSTVASH